MEFEACAASTSGAKKKNKNKKKSKSKNINEGAGSQANIEDEFSAFLFLLDMDEDDEDTADEGARPPLSWTDHTEQEAEMSASYITSLATTDQKDLEAEFLRQFLTHVAWKKYLSLVEMRQLKDRVFLLMAKEKEAESASVSSEGTNQDQILYGHFLYEELRLQHQYLTTPKVTDTPNDTAFKVSMVPVICGLIRNINQSRDIACLDVQDDEEESAALFRTPVAPPGSCLSSVLRPLYRHLQEAHRQSKQGHEDEEGEQECSSDSGLSPRLQALCCSSTTTTNSGYNNNNNNSTSSSPSSVSMFFDGPPEWHYNLPFFMKRVQYSKPSPEKMGFVKHALRSAQAVRVVQEQKLFYDLAYSRAHRNVTAAGAGKDTGESESYHSLALPFRAHMMLHRAAHATVSLKTSAKVPSDSDPLTLAAFKRLVTVQLPRVLVAPCSRCATLCTGECVCGSRYCSAECLAADRCDGCAHLSCPELKYLTPVAWGRTPLEITS